MIALIVLFYLFAAGYLAAFALYVGFATKKLMALPADTPQAELAQNIMITLRVVTYLSLAFTVICTGLLIGYRSNARLSPPKIGLVLSLMVLFFYLAFTAWYIIRQKLKQGIKRKHGYELDKSVLFNVLHVMSISMLALLVLELVAATILISLP